MGFSLKGLLKGVAADLNWWDDGKSHGNMRGKSRPAPASTARPRIRNQFGDVNQGPLEVGPVKKPMFMTNSIAPVQAPPPLQVGVAKQQPLQIGNVKIQPSLNSRTAAPVNKYPNVPLDVQQKLNNPKFGGLTDQQKQDLMAKPVGFNPLTAIPSSAAGAINKVLIEPAVNTVKLPYEASRVLTANVTGNEQARENAITALNDKALNSYIAPLAQTAVLAGNTWAANDILNDPNTSDELKQIQLQHVNEGLAPIGFNLNDTQKQTNLKGASLFAQDIATPIITKGAGQAFKTAKSSVTNSGIRQGVTSQLVRPTLAPSQTINNVTTKLVDVANLVKPRPLNEIGAVGKNVNQSAPIKILNKPQKLVHYTDTKPAISTNPDRFIPDSISLSKPGINAVFGKNKFDMELPKGAKVMTVSKEEFNKLYKGGNSGQGMTPIEVGKILHQRAKKAGADVIHVKNPNGAGDEWAVINPKTVGLKSPKPRAIHKEDQATMNDFVQYTKGKYKPKSKDAHELEIEASRIAEHYGLPMPKTTKELGKAFEKELATRGFNKPRPIVGAAQQSTLSKTENYYHGTRNTKLPTSDEFISVTPNKNQAKAFAEVRVLGKDTSKPVNVLPVNLPKGKTKNIDMLFGKERDNALRAAKKEGYDYVSYLEDGIKSNNKVKTVVVLNPSKLSNSNEAGFIAPGQIASDVKSFGNKIKSKLKPLNEEGFAKVPGKALKQEAPIVGPNLSRSSKASQKLTKTQEQNQLTSSSKSQVSQDKTSTTIIPPKGKTKSSINTENLNLTKKQKTNISKESQQVVDTLSNKDVEQLAKSAGLNKATYSNEQTKKIIAEQLTVRQDAVRLQNEAEAARKAGNLELAADKLRQSYEMATISTDQGRNVARQLQARRIMANELNTPQQRVFKILDTAGVNPDVYIPKLAQIDFNDTNAVIKAYREMVPASAEQWLDKIRYTNMLSSPLTHIVNVTSNAQGVVGITPIRKAFEGGVDAVHHAATGAPRTRFAGEAGHYYKGVAKTFPEAAARFKAVMSGKTMSRNPDYAAFMNAPLARGGTKGIADQIYSFVPKLLEASDQFATTLVKGGEMKALKYRASKGVSMTAEQIDNTAEDAASYVVFRQDLEKAGQGHLLDMIDFIPKTIGKGRTSKNPYIRNITKFTFPFVNTPTNLFKQGIEYSPVGVLTLHGSADKTAQVAKMAMGTSAIGLIAGTLGAKGDLTFGEPSNADERNAFRAEGKQPYAFKIPGTDKWFGYSKLHPAIAFNFALVAAAKDMKDKRSLDESGLQQFLGTGANVLGFFRDQSYMKNVGDITSIFQSKDGTGLDNLFANQATNTLNQLSPFKSMVSWIGRQVDPTQRKVDYSKSAPEQIYQGIIKDIPNLNKVVPARINPYTGEPIKNDNPILNSWSPVRVTNDKGYGNTTSLNVNQREQLRDLPASEKEAFRRGIVEDKAAKNRVAKEKDAIKKSESGDTKTLSDGKVYSKVDGEYKTFDSKEDAKIASEKKKFEKSKDSYKVVGNTVFTKNSEGKVSQTTKVAYDYKVNTEKLQSYKANGDVENWVNTANAQLDSINKQLKDKNIDPLDKIRLENDAASLQKSVNKYVGYGGFTKPKTGRKGGKGKGKGRSGSGFDYAKGLSNINKVASSNQNAVRNIVKKNRIKHRQTRKA